MSRQHTFLPKMRLPTFGLCCEELPAEQTLRQSELRVAGSPTLGTSRAKVTAARWDVKESVGLASLRVVPADDAEPLFIDDERSFSADCAAVGQGYAGDTPDHHNRARASSFPHSDSSTSFGREALEEMMLYHFGQFERRIDARLCLHHRSIEVLLQKQQTPKLKGDGLFRRRSGASMGFTGMSPPRVVTDMEFARPKGGRRQGEEPAAFLLDEAFWSEAQVNVSDCDAPQAPLADCSVDEAALDQGDACARRKESDSSTPTPPIEESIHKHFETKEASACSWRPRCLTAVGGTRFELFFAAATLLDALCLGIEVQWRAHFDSFETPMMFAPLEMALVLLFALELLMRAARHGTRQFFLGPGWQWAWFDLGLVLASAAEVLCDVGTWVGEFPRSSLEGAVSVRAIRLIRLLRIVQEIRTPKCMHWERPLRHLVQSFTATLKSVFWLCVIMFLTTYTYGVLFTQAVLHHTYVHQLTPCIEDGGVALCIFFGDLSASIFTLFKSVAGGVMWHDVVEPLGSVGSGWVWLFASFVALVHLGLFSLLVALFCQSAAEVVRQDPDMVCQSLASQRSKYVEHVNRVFRRENGMHAGFITLQEYEHALKEGELPSFFSAIHLDAGSACELFKLIDAGGANVIKIEEFVDGCLRLRSSARVADVEKLLAEQKRFDKKVNAFFRAIDTRDTSNAAATACAGLNWRQPN